MYGTTCRLRLDLVRSWSDLDTGSSRAGLVKAVCCQHRTDYPSHTPDKKARKRKHKKAAEPNQITDADDGSKEAALQLEELGLPAAFGSSKASTCNKLPNLEHLHLY